MTNTPKAPFGDGRDLRGRFTMGNPGGPGNPLAAKVSKLRSALISAISEQDIIDIAEALVRQAKEGDVTATRELLLRTLGRPVEADLLQRLEEIELKLEVAVAHQ